MPPKCFFFLLIFNNWNLIKLKLSFGWFWLKNKQNETSSTSRTRVSHDFLTNYLQSRNRHCRCSLKWFSVISKLKFQSILIKKPLQGRRSHKNIKNLKTIVLEVRKNNFHTKYNATLSPFASPKFRSTPQRPQSSILPKNTSL